MAIENDDLLYVYDTSEGTGKKIKYENLKSGTGGTGEFGYWDRSGTNLSPVNSGDNLDNIGSASFAGSITANGSNDSSQRAYVYAGTDGVAPQFQVRVPSTFSSTPQPAFNVERSGSGSAASISTDGSASFAGDKIKLNANGVIENKYIILDDVAPGGITGRIQVRTNGVTVGQIDSGGNFYIGNTAGTGDNISAFTASIKSDGSAAFAGTVTGARFKTDGSRNPGFVHNDGTKDVFAVQTSRLLLGNSADINANPNIELNIDGSAEFAGDVEIGGTLPASPNISLKGDGSASFAGKLKVAADLNGQFAAEIENTSSVNANGLLIQTPNRAGTSSALKGVQIKDSGGEVAAINMDGSATFAGKVTSASTEDTDADTTLVTKDYVDAKAGGGGTSTEINVVGSLIFARPQTVGPTGAWSYGEQLESTHLRYASTGSTATAPVPSGTYQCLGECPAGDATLWQRIS